MKRIILFIVAFILWLLLTWTLNWQWLVVGIVVSLVVTCIFGNLFIKKPNKIFQIRRWVWFLIYLPLFLVQCIKANFDVAYRVLHPKMPINPGIVKVHTILNTDIAKTWLANSITLTPGTLSVDIEGNWLYVHWINVRSKKEEEATRMIVGRFETILKKIFE